MAARSITFDSPYSWRELYIAAMIETDNKRLPERIRAAEEAIALRLISLTGCTADDDTRATRGRQAIFTNYSVRSL